MKKSINKIILCASLLSVWCHSPLLAMKIQVVSVPEKEYFGNLAAMGNYVGHSVKKFVPFTFENIVKSTTSATENIQSSPILTKKNIILGGLALGTASYGLYSFMQYFNMYRIHRWLTTSSTLKDDDKDFKYSAWLQIHFENASDLLDKEDEVQHHFQITNEEDIIKIPNENGITIKNITLKDLKAEIKKEITSTQSDLEILANLTQLPSLIVSKANKSFKKPAVYNSSVHNTLIAHCKKCIVSKNMLKGFEAIIFDAFKEITNTFINYSDFIDIFAYRPCITPDLKTIADNNLSDEDESSEEESSDDESDNYDKEKEKEAVKKTNSTIQAEEAKETTIGWLHHLNPFNWKWSSQIKERNQRSNNPLAWSLKITQEKSTKLYYNVLKRYLRLLAIHAIVLEIEQNIQPQKD